MPDLAERVQLDIESRFNPTGVNQAVRKLEALDSAIKSIHNRLAGLDAAGAFPRTRASLRDLIAGLQSQGPTNLASISRVLGYDPEKVADAHRRLLENLRATERRAQGTGAQREALRQYNRAATTFQGAGRRVESAEKAAEFFSEFSKQAVVGGRQLWAQIRAAMTGNAAASAPTPPASVPSVQTSAAPIPIIIPTDRIVATLGPGVIPLIVQTNQLAGQPTAVTHAPTPSATPPVPASAPSPSAAVDEDFFPQLHGRIISRELIEKPNSPLRIRERLITEIDGVEQEVTQYLKDVEGTLRGVKQVFHEAGDEHNAPTLLKEEALAQREAAATKRAADQAVRRRINLLRNTENLTERTEEDRTGISVDLARRANRAARINRQRREERGTLNSRLADLPPAEQTRIRGLRLPTDAMERQIKSVEEIFRANEAALKNLSPRFQRRIGMLRRVGGYDEQYLAPQIATERARTDTSIADARRANQAASVRRERQEQRAQLEGRISALPPADQARIRAMGLSYDALAREIRNTEHALAALGRTNGASSRDFIRNTVHVTTWAASVATLYGALGLLKYGLENVISVGGQMARLDQIFKHVGGTSVQLTDQTLQLAAANGRLADEAMESGIQWSRLGGTAAQVGTLVRSSLLEANVAQISSAEATEHLSAVMQSYGLSVGGVVSLVGELNAVSNTYNVTNKDLLGGLSRTAILAKQAALPLHELIGLIGGTVGATGQSGANIGNAIKSTIAAVSNPALQEKLRDQFHFEVTTKGGGELQSLSEIIGNLFAHYNELTDVEQKHLVVQIAGKTQANRLTAVLDNYVQSMVLAVRAAGNLNTAEVENAKIKASLKSQLQGLSAEFIRFANIQANQGVGSGNRWTFSINAGLRDATEGLKNFGTVLNAPGISTGVTVVIGLLTALGIKMAAMSIATRAAAMSGGAAATGIINNTIAALSGLGGAIGKNFKKLFYDFSVASKSGGPLVRGFASMVGAVDFFGASVQSLGGKMMAGTKGLTSLAGASVLARSFLSPMNTVLGVLAASFGTLTRAIAGSLVLFRSLLPVAATMALLWGGVKLFDSGMDKLGLHIEHTTQELAGWNEQAEIASAKAEKFATAARLFRTVGQALPSMPPDKQEKTIKALASVNALEEPDDAKRASREKELADRMRNYLRGPTPDFAGLNSLLEQQSLGAVHQSQLASQKAFEERIKAAGVAEKKITELQTQKANPITRLFGGAEKIQKNIDELEQQKLQAHNKAIQILSEENDELQHSFEGNVKILSALEQQKGVLQSIADIYSELPSKTPLGKAVAEKNQLEDQLRFLKNEKARINSAQAAQSKDEAATGVQRGQLEQNESGLQRRLLEVNTRLRARGPAAEHLAELQERRGSITNPEDRQQLSEQINAARKRAESEASSESARAHVLGFLFSRTAEKYQEVVSNTGKANLNKDLYARQQLLVEIAQIEKQIKDLPGEQSEKRKQLNEELAQQLELTKKLIPELEKVSSPAYIESRRKQTIVQSTVERVQYEIEPSRVGYGEGEKLLNEQTAVTQMLKAQAAERDRLEKISKRSSEEEDALLSSKTRYNALLSQQGQNLLTIEHAKADALREQRQLMIDMNREAQRSLLMAKPGDLLRAMAAFQLTGGKAGKMTGGQFLAMSPETREWANRFDPTFDPRMMELRRTRQLLGQPLSDKEFNTRYHETATKQVSLGIIEPQFDAAAKAATEFARAVSIAGTSITEFGTMIRNVMDKLGDMVKPSSHVNAGPEPSQMRGRGGADGAN